MDSYIGLANHHPADCAGSDKPTHLHQNISENKLYDNAASSKVETVSDKTKT
jgi:hypothetical protein